jgi:predicted enzyme related to lactoylglutathione lyase
MATDRESPLTAGRLGYLFLSVRDLPRMLAFYRDALGFETEFEVEGAIAFLRLAGDEGPLLALSADEKPVPSGDRHWFLVIDVRGLDEVVATLRERGVEVDRIEDVPYGRAAMLRDPEGNQLEIHEPDR